MNLKERNEGCMGRSRERKGKGKLYKYNLKKEINNLKNTK